MRGLPPYLVDLCRRLRKRTTPGEEMLWQCLRRHQLGGLKFRRQHPLGRFAVDFCCTEKRLVIEIDGGIHLENLQSLYDANRDEIISSRGFKILRFRNEKVIEHTEQVLSEILMAAQDNR